MIQVAGCFCEWEGRALLLLRAPHTVQGGTWCLPGGKVEPLESPLEAAVRETWEEVGIRLEASDLVSMGEISFPRYIFHLYRVDLQQAPKVKLSLAEHTDYTWVAPEHAHKLPLIEGGHLVFERLSNFSS